MFVYEECKIISGIPLSDIKQYLLCELGAKERLDRTYEYNGLEIEVTACMDRSFPSFSIPRHLINVRGDRTLAEQFLTTFRFRFMSAGG